MKLNRKYTWLWLAWLALFGFIEWRAIKSPEKGDTLSEHVWALIGKRGFAKTGFSVFWRAAVAVLLVWQGGHYFGSW